MTARAGRLDGAGVRVGPEGDGAASGVGDGGEDDTEVVVIKAGQHLGELDGGAGGEAGGDAQHLFLAGRADEPAVVDGGEGGVPVDDRHGRRVAERGEGLEVGGDEVVTGEPGPLSGDDHGGCLGA